MVVFVRLLDHRYRVLSFDEQQECSGQELKKQIMETKCLPVESEHCFFLVYNGRVLNSDSKLPLDRADILVSCHARLAGGKGGFGSMLRAIGAQIEKTTNREACRDLSGRRMRDVNDEKKIADWLAKQSEREQEKARLKQERLERLKSAPRHVFEDSTKYTSELQENLNSVEDALQKGLKSGSTSLLGKRKPGEKSRKRRTKKQKLWLGIDEDLSSGSDEESDVGSCSSVAESDDMGSEASSRISSMASGRNSEAETSDNKGNESSSEPEDRHQSKVKNTASATVTSSSVSSLTDIACNEIGASTLERTEEHQNQARGEEKAVTPDVVTESGVKSNKKESDIPESVSVPLDLDQYQSKEELEALGLDVLKSSLIALGLKCGGTLQQRAERLFSIKNIPRDKIDPSLLAKPSGKRQGNKKGKQSPTD